MNFTEMFEKSPKDAVLTALTCIILQDNFEEQKHLYQELKDFLDQKAKNGDPLIEKLRQIFEISSNNRQIILKALKIGEKNTAQLLKIKIQETALDPKKCQTPNNQKNESKNIIKWWE